MNLARILAAVEAVRSAEDSRSAAQAGDELADAVEALDEWLAGGGFRPKRWAVA